MKAQHRQREGIQYKHDLGQHFLYDTALLTSLVERTGVSKEDSVLEIGPGSGALTRCLSQAAARVVAVEVDEAILPYLRATLKGAQNVTVVQGDIRRQDLKALCTPLGEGFYVIANIPYNITTPILQLFLGSDLPVRQMSVMIQKEVADKLLALPGDENYGLTSFKCRYYCEPEMVAVVPAEMFTPPPKVDSAFVNLRFRKAPLLPIADEALLFRMVTAAFNLRRKTLCNALSGVLSLSGDELRGELSALSLSPTVRGEALSIPQWIALANACARRADSAQTIL